VGRSGEKKRHDGEGRASKGVEAILFGGGDQGSLKALRKSRGDDGTKQARGVWQKMEKEGVHKREENVSTHCRRLT